MAGLDVVQQPTAVRSVIGLAGQYAAVDEVLTGRENLEMVGRLYRLSARVAKQRAEEALERLGLTDAADRPVRTYSGGMRRRLDLGASLVGQPRILILTSRRRVLIHPHGAVGLHEATGAGRHDDPPHDPVPGGGRRAGQLHRGHRPRPGHRSGDGGRAQVAARGDVLEVGVEHAGDMDRVVAALAALGAESSQVDGDGRHHPDQRGPAALVDAVRALDDAQIPIADLALRRPSLDDVFLALTGRKTTADGDGVQGNGAGPGRGRRRGPDRSNA